MRAKNKLVRGIGINDADYPVYKCGDENNLGKCPYYHVWSSMLTRGHSKKFKDKRPSYKDAKVCDEWIRFTGFKKWMERQDWNGKELDKDLINIGNKTYSPENCCFVSHSINMLLIASNRKRGSYKIGVHWKGAVSKFQSQCNDGFGKHKCIGYFDDPEDAHKAWCKFKAQVIRKVVQEDKPDKRVEKSLLKVADDLDKYILWFKD